MRVSAILSFASLVAATPVTFPRASPVEQSLLERQLTRPVANELTLGPCRSVIFIFARGTLEIGNMGEIVGPVVADQLKRRLSDEGVAVQGVPYAALVSTNFLPGGTDPASMAQMTTLFNLADTKCPDSVFVVGGYSQGAAVCHRSIEKLPQRIKDKIKAVVLFGDTQKRADRNAIPGFDASRIRFFCDDGLDLVCDGVIAAAALLPHLSYGAVSAEAGNWLADHV
ncbi:cutinase [Xylaria intraflava]|nr:cutinase [Xylaria intraflava]